MSLSSTCIVSNASIHPPQYSMPLTGTQIDAIYHTSLILNGVEYYYGQGIQTAVPGSTHHGQPMEKLHLGQTELPLDVIEEYIQSMAEIYTPEVRACVSCFLHYPQINS